METTQTTPTRQELIDRLGAMLPNLEEKIVAIDYGTLVDIHRCLVKYPNDRGYIDIVLQPTITNLQIVIENLPEYSSNLKRKNLMEDAIGLLEQIAETYSNA